MNAGGFRDLTVYQVSYGAALEIFKLTKSFPKDERFELTTQVRRSSRAVAELIAEAYRRRRYINAFVNKLSEADAEATETQVWLDFSKDCDYLPSDQHAKLTAKYEAVGRMLNKMMADPSPFQIR